MIPKILADENIDFRIVRLLRQKNIEVISILESYRGITDKEVLEISKMNKSIILTQDSDFGEWVFSHKERVIGVIFLRYNPIDYESITETLFTILNDYNINLYNKFVVISSNKYRIRDIL